MSTATGRHYLLDGYSVVKALHALPHQAVGALYTLLVGVPDPHEPAVTQSRGYIDYRWLQLLRRRHWITSEKDGDSYTGVHTFASYPYRAWVPTALYRHLDADGRLLYVGISVNPFERTQYHRHCAHWFRRVATIQIDWFPSRDLARAAEDEITRAEGPLYNAFEGTGGVTSRPRS